MKTETKITYLNNLAGVSDDSKNDLYYYKGLSQEQPETMLEFLYIKNTATFTFSRKHEEGSPLAGRGYLYDTTGSRLNSEEGQFLLEQERRKYKKVNPEPVVEYYYPKAEEIRVGFEGEVNWSRGYSEEYQPVSLKLINEDNGMCRDVEEVLTDCFWDGMSEVRVPFLTDNQIIKEGWIPFPESNYSSLFVFNCSHIVYNLIFDKSGKRVNIQWVSEIRESRHLVPAYNGPCPTINHLRDIMRLLNIKKNGDTP